MKVKDLIEALECYNPEAEVNIQIQRTYPLRVTLEGVTSDKDIEFARACEDHDKDDDNGFTQSETCHDVADETVVYLLEGSHLGYGDRIAWDAERR